MFGCEHVTTEMAEVMGFYSKWNVTFFLDILVHAEM